MNEDFDLIPLLSNPDPVQVSVARDRLEKADIPSQVQNENFGSLYGQGAIRMHRFSEPRLMVFRKDARRAAKVIGVDLPPGFDDSPRVRRPGIIGWLRWIAGLD